MKKLIMCLISVFALISVQGQSPITLTFQAKDSLTQIPLALDSVNVKNLTENCDTTLYDAISSLTLLATWPVGIDQNDVESSGSFVLLQNFPNPFQGSTSVRIYLKVPGKLHLAVYDIRGNLLSEYAKNFERGWHLFDISTGQSRELVLKVSDHTTTKTIKILCSDQGHEGESISCKGQTAEVSHLKSARDAAGFIFYLGNQLQYTAYAGGYQTSTLLDQPISSRTYNFAMLPNPFSCGDIVSYEGQDYHTVLIGTQCWFRDNLNVGSRIDGSQAQANNGILEKFCYQDNESNCDIYGGLYQWDEVMQYVITDGAKGICPDGWHIPKNTEYTLLSNYLGGNYLAGGKMKEAGFVHWSLPNTGATNSSGFTALPGGLREPASFSAIQLAGYFWTSTIQGTNKWYCLVGYDVASLERYSDQNPLLGFSMRCLKD